MWMMVFKYNEMSGCFLSFKINQINRWFGFGYCLGKIENWTWKL